MHASRVNIKKILITKFKQNKIWCSHFQKVYFLSNKSEVLSNLKSYLTWCKRREINIKTLRSDNGTEFKNKNMIQLLEKEGIVHQFSVNYTPQQNNKIIIVY